MLHEVHFIAPVMANATLYWTCPSLLINDSLLGRSSLFADHRLLVDHKYSLFADLIILRKKEWIEIFER